MRNPANKQTNKQTNRHTKVIAISRFSRDNYYQDKKDEGLDYVKQDVLYIAFNYARYCEAMQEITAYSMKDSLSAPFLIWKF